MSKNYNLKNYQWSVDGLERCIKDNKLESEIILKTDKAAIVHVKSYADSMILGQITKWCICEHESSWKQYVIDNKAIQLFVYRFDEKPEDDNGLYGATIINEKNKPKTYCAFSKLDNPLAQVKNCDTDGEALFMEVIIPAFGNVVDELKKMFINIFNDKIEEKKVEEKKWYDMPIFTATTPYCWNDSFSIVYDD